MGTPINPEVAAQVAPSIVQVLLSQTGPPTDTSALRRSSGIAVDGGVITSDRYIGDADTAELVTSTGQRGVAQAVWRSPIRDLVLLRTDLSVPSADLEPANEQRPGEPVVVLGNLLDGQGNVVLATFSGQVGSVQTDLEGITYLQTSARVPPDLAGGVVVNLRGHVVGGPSLRIDEASGTAAAVGGEEAQALVTQPPQPASSTSTYQGDDGHAILPTPTDVGPDWRVERVPPDAHTGADAARLIGFAGPLRTCTLAHVQGVRRHPTGPRPRLATL
jgi:S1-C subfamily serine protease